MRRISTLMLVFLLLDATAAFAFSVIIIKSKDLPDYNEAIAGFRSACPMQITEYDMMEMFERATLIVNKINEVRPDIVIAVGAKAAIVARRQITTIPVVFTMVLDPESLDLKAPNVTGVTMAIPELTQLKALKGIKPKLARVGAIYNPGKSQGSIEEAKRAAASLGIVLVAAPISDESDAPGAIGQFDPGVDAVWLPADPFVVMPRVFAGLTNYCYSAKIPLMVFTPQFVRQGGLLSLSVSYSNIGQQTCAVAREIVEKKKSPGSIPFADPRGLEMTFNMKISKWMEDANLAWMANSFANMMGYKFTPVE